MKSCPTATWRTDATPRGELSLRSDGTFTFRATLDATVHVTFPATCLEHVDDCAAVQATFEAPKTFRSVRCSGAKATACRCEFDGHPVVSDVSGTYRVEDGVLVVTAAGSEPRRRPYCVTGRTLRWQQGGKQGTLETFSATR